MTLLHIQQYGNTFEVRLTTDAVLNAWSGKVILPANMRIQEITYGESIGDIWQAPPTASGQEIDFAGGRTTGFTGNGLLFRFYASAEPGMNMTSPELIRFDAAQTKIYAADGRGTPVAATLQSLTVNTKELVSVSSSGLIADTVPPEPFEVVLVRDKALFDGKAAIVFSASDADSGIGHYEIEEQTRQGTIRWHQAESPYLLDPEIRTVLVKAFDRAGNFRVESVVFQEIGPSAMEISFFGGFILIIILSAVYLMRRWQKHR